MSNALSAVLQGLERGSTIGLDYYQAMKNEARANRNEARTLARDAENDRRYEEGVAYRAARDRVADDQWERNFTREGEQWDKEHDIAKRNAAVNEGTLQLSRDQFNYNRDTAERQRREANDVALFKTSLIGDDGQYITDQYAYAERVNNNPQMLKAMLGTAVASGMISAERANGYTGAQLVPTANGLVLRVAGRDATGAPIKPGGAPLTANGTSDPDDPVIEINMTQLRNLVDPNFREAQRSASLADAQVQGIRTRAEQALAASAPGQQRALAKQDAEIERIQAELDAAKQDEASSRVSLGGPNASHVQFSPATGRAQTLSAELERAQSQRANSAREYENSNKYIRDSAQAGIESVRGQHRLYGEGYLTRQQTLSQALPGQQDAAYKNFDTRIKNIAGTLPSTRSKNYDGMTRNEAMTLLSQFPPELQLKLGDPTNREADSVLYGIMDTMARTGYKGNPAFLLNAAEAGGDLDAYAQAAMSPQLADRTPEERDAIALEISREMKANPELDFETVAGQVVAGFDR